MNPKVKNSGNVLRYSGIGIQIAATFSFGFFLGYKTDEWLNNTKPYFTTLFAIIFLAAGFYLALRDLMKK